MATTPILRGTRIPQLQYWEIDFSPTQGGKLVKEYKGIDIGEMSALCNSLANTHSGKLRYEKNVATLTLETTNLTGGGGVPGGINSPVSSITDKWEISVDQEKPELWENKNFLGLFTTLDDSYPLNPISQITASVLRQTGNNGSANDAWTNFLKAAKALDVSNLTGNDPLPKPNLYYLLKGFLNPFSNMTGLSSLKLFANDYFRGRTNFLRGKYVLRHTTSAPSNFGPNQADFNVEKIYTISKLLTECQSTALWYLPLPGYLAYKILAYPVPVPMPPNYVWGALKTGSNAVTAARNRVEITTEYIIDACPVHTYGLAT